MMTDKVEQTIVNLLKESGVMKTSVKEFHDILYGSNEVCSDRIEILTKLMSLFSTDYERDLQETANVETEITRQLFELKITTNANKHKFVEGKSPLAEQKLIYSKIFSLLSYVLFSKKPERDVMKEYTVDLSTQTKEKQTILKKSRPNKDFDLNKAFNTLNHTKALLEQSAKSVMLNVPASTITDSKAALCPGEWGELTSKLDSAANCCNEIFRKQSWNNSDVKEPAPEELAEAVGNLYNDLPRFNKDPSKESVETPKDIDLRKTLEDIKEWEKNSNICKFQQKTVP